MNSFFDFTLLQLREFFKDYGKEKFRAQQLYKWVYERRIQDWSLMSNISKNFRLEMEKIFYFLKLEIKAHQISKDGTEKFLFQLEDLQTVEAVLIPVEDRITLCVSSEVGCNMACRFCYTAHQKLKRRLKAGEIVCQFLMVQDLLRKRGKKLTNIVFMGMGEPLDNSDEVFKSIEILHEPFGLNFSKRKITVSTSGIIPEIHKVTQSKVRLAVSLNSYDDASRTQLMPINLKYPLKDLLQACRKHTSESKDKVTFEYVLIKGLTDEIDHARKLFQLTRSVPCKINIIPFNEHPGSPYLRPAEEQVEKFHEELMRLGAHVLRRRTMGQDISAACGQLNSLVQREKTQQVLKQEETRKSFLLQAQL